MARPILPPPLDYGSAIIFYFKSLNSGSILALFTSMEKKRFVVKVIGLFLVTLAACGSDVSSTSKIIQKEEARLQQERHYRFVLSPVNPNLESNATGIGNFNIQGDEMTVDLQLSGVPDAVHPQYVYVGTRCPNPTADTNSDSIIDAEEALVVTGGQLIPLDSDLRTQDAGGIFPQGETNIYKESISLYSLVSDLKLPDVDPSDQLLKLGPEEKLNLEGKIVMIHGIPDGSELPSTVKGLGSLTPEQALPVLCGSIIQEESMDENTFSISE